MPISHGISRARWSSPRRTPRACASSQAATLIGLNSQGQLARILIGQDAQLAFNMKKGSMPIRTDIDLAQANPCMQKALGLLENGLLPSGDWALSSDTQQQLQDLNIEFLGDLSITVDDYVERYASIIESAD